MEAQPLKNILNWSGGRLIRGAPSGMVRGISIDTRTLTPGEIFVALPGKNYNGHEFAPRALARGAVGVIVQEGTGGSAFPVGEGSIIEVENTYCALANLARGYRSTLELRVVAVTGSNGKTTTKNLIGQLIKKRKQAVIAKKSYNNIVGVSLTVFELERHHDTAVFELGMNHRGEIRELGKICRPEIGVILNIGPAHIGLMGGLEQITRGKGELLEALEGERTAVFNYDDARLRSLADTFRGKRIYFGLHQPASIRAEDVHFQPDLVTFNLSLFSRSYRLRSPLPGIYNLYNLLAAVAVADQLGINPAEMQAALLKVELPPMRFERLSIGGAMVFNDAYNANPASMKAALKAWLRMPVGGKRILISGDMNELGDFTDSFHQAWGEEVGKAGLDYVIFVGPCSRRAAPAAVVEACLKGKFWAVSATIFSHWLSKRTDQLLQF